MQHPSIFWAQTKEVVYLRIQVNQAEDVKVDIQEKAFSFSCTAHGQQYACEFNLYKALDTQGCRYKNIVQAVEVLLKKKEAEKQFWPTLQEGAKLPYVRVDFDRWIDEDYEEKPQESIPDFGGFGGQNLDGFDPSMFKMPEGEQENDCGCCGDHGKCEDCKCGGECKCADGCKCGDGCGCANGGECGCGDCKCDKHEEEEKHE